jgi:excisionase family DNA binding protein
MKSEDIKGSRLWSIKHAADELSLSPHTLRRWIFQGRLPCVRLGRRCLLDPADIERFIAEHRSEPAGLFARRG